jgi:hypothetical protein
MTPETVMMMQLLIERAEHELTAIDDGIHIDYTCMDEDLDEHMNQPHVVDDNLLDDPDVTLDSQQYKQYKSC